MKNLYIPKTNFKLNYAIVIMVFLLGVTSNVNAQVKKAFTQRTSQYTPTKKIYNVKGDFTMLGNTNLTPQNYGATTNNNGQFMTYVDIDGDPNTFNSSSSTLTLSSENGAIPSCSNIVYAGLYWTGKSSSNSTFNVTKQVATGTQSINNNLNVIHNQNINNTNYSLSVTRGGSNGNRHPIYTFSGNGNTYAFSFFNSSATNRVTLSVNGGSSVNIPVTVNGSGTEATLNSPYVITDGTVTLTIKKLIRNAGTNLGTTDTQNFSNADVNVSGTTTVFSNITKAFNKRVVSLKGPTASGYTQITASTNDIYYPSGSDDDIYSAYAEITDYVRTNGIGQYTVADMALLEGNVGGTGYSGGWGIIVVYENSKMRWRDVTIFDGYAYVASTNTSGFDLPVSGFNTVQTGNVGMKLGVMASEGDVSFTGDYFRIRNLNTTNYTNLSHTGNATGNFFNSSINVGGTRNPNLVNNTGIDIAMIDIPNTGNSIIGNNQTSTNFRYGTTSDTYSIFTIAMSVDAYVPEVEGLITATTMNGAPAVQPYSLQPGQEAGFSVDIKNIGSEAINNYKLIIPIPYNATYVAGSASGIVFSPQNTPTPNNISFNPSLGVTGSLVWDFGTLVLPANSNTVLARLTFRLKATTDCSILNNSSCSSLIAINGNSTGIGNTTSVALNNSNLIQGYTSNGSCVGEPIPTPINVGINGASYVSENCPNTNIVRNFTYCSSNTSVGTSEIASNFPPGSLFYNEFPVTINSIQYSDSNPIPLVAGSTINYFAVPAGGGNGCNFPFTISKCPQIIAQDDTLNGGNGTTGNTNIGNVLSNNGNGTDTVNGVAALISQVTITVVTPATSIGSNPVPVINTTTGQVSVPPGTPAGVYTIVYQICEINNNSNCDSATVTITVTRPIIDAVNDAGAPIVGANGGQSLTNVLANDTLNGNTATLATVNLTQVSTTNSGVTLNPLDGSVNVAPGTPSGSYTVTYQICEKINPTNCDTAIVTVNVTNAPINAVDDNGTPIVGAVGGQSVANVLVNDTLNGNPATLSNVILTQVSTTNPGVTLNTTTGAVNVAPGTPSGSYTLTYQICETLNPTNCDTAIVTVNVTNAPINAVDDNGTPIVGAVGGQSVANVLVNDTLNGNPATLSNVILTQVSTTNPGVTLNTTTGAVNVAPGTPSGSYTLTYQICETLNPTNCDTAIVTVNVTNAPINAVDDIYKDIVCPTSGIIENILTNDTFNGLQVSLTDVNLNVISGNSSVISISNNGNLVIAVGASCGDYVLTYEICEKLNPTNCDTATVTVSITDNTAPTWTTAAAALDATVECSDAAALATAQAQFPVATDLCDTDVTNIVKSTGQFVASSTCANAGSYTNTWTVTDACGNTSAVFTQTINVVDTTAPTWTTAAAALNATVECSDAAALATAQAQFPVATDLCDTDVTNIVKSAGQFVASSTCANAGSYTNTWTVTDACGNTSAVFTQTINVVDTTAPTWTTAAASLDATVECSDAAALATAQAQFPVATDLCDTDVTNIVKSAGQFVASSTCANAGSYTNTWTVTDACGNTSAVFTQTINVVDTTAPTWTTAAASLDATVECSDAAALATAQAQFPVATDLCDTDVTNIVKSAGQFVASSTCANAGSYTNTWTVTDACGNTSAVFTQTINVVDTTAPTWTTAAASLDATVECSDAAALATAQAQFPVATDLCDTDVTNIVKSAGQFVASSTCANAGSYTNTWTVTDACGNTSAVFTQTINVVDTTAPTWTTAAASLDATVECSDAAALATAQAQFPVATDLCDTDVTNIVKSAGQFVASSTCANAGSYTNTWTVTDACGNTSAVFTQTINVVDTTAPTWTTAAASLDATVECSDAAALATAQAQFPVATDLCDTDVTNIVKSAGQFVASSTCANAGSYTNTWTVTDACGNTSAVFTQTINVVDTTAPTWTTAAASLDATVECSDAAALATAQAQFPVATDLCDTDVTNIVKSAGQFVASSTCANAGSYTNTWTVTDACGNTSAVFTQTINVVDTTAPTWTTAAASLDATVECSDAAALATAQAQFPVATDLCDTDVTNIVKSAGQFVASSTCANAGSYTNTWTVTDACGNTSAVFTQTINVVDTTAPTWTTAAASLDATVECSDAAALATAQAQFPVATDLCDTDVTNIVKSAGQFVASSTCANAGSYTNTWTVTDACGNTSAVFTQTINVVDTTAPTWTTAAASLDATVECSDAAALATAQAQFPVATDLCDTDVTNIVKSAGQFVASSTCANAGSYTNTWTVTDACGNTSAVFTQTINVVDTTDPVISTQASNIIVECDGEGNENALTNWLNNHGGAIASDNCSEVTWTNNFNEISGDCSAAVTVIFTATDACGNDSTTSATFTVSDTQNPIAPEAPVAVTVACEDEIPAIISLTATDNCSGVITAQGVDNVAQGECPNSFTVTRTWTFTDACDNTSSVSQIITVNDTVAPVAPEAPAAVTVACADDIPAMISLTATDNCNDAITAQGVDTVAQGDCANSFTVTRTWTFTDACDNTSSVSQIITVNDTVAPVAPEAPAAVTLACADDIPAMISLTATDNCNDAITAQGVDTVAQGECPNSFTVTRTWTFTDACDNTSSVSQIITVNDTVAPVAPEAPAAVTVACADDIPAMISLTATDNCNDAITAQGVDAITQGDCANSFTVTRTWTFTDACDNTSSVSQIITVNDTVAPVAPEAPAALTLACADDIPAMISLTATDNCNDAITAQGVDTVAQGECPNSFTVTRTWTFTDACDNTSSVSQIITVNDTVAPVAPEAPAAVTVACADDIPVMISLTATDNCNDAITAQGVDTVAQGECPNSFTVTRTWTFTDACDNTSSVSQIITVNDTVAPVAPEAPAAVTVACADDIPVMISLTATDNCNDAITAQGVDAITQGDCANSFTVTRTWTFTDACDNTSSVSQIITVNDTVAPVAPEAPAALTLACADDIPAMISLTATDNCNDAITAQGVDTVAQGECPNSFTVTRTWTFTDACDNTSSVSQIITVNDTVAPVAPEAPAAVTVACADDIPVMISLTATDNCNDAITAQGVDTVAQGECPNSFTVTRTWTFTDACDNTSSVSQIITVNDTVAPVAPEAPAAVTVACADDIPVMISLTATDNCNDAITAQGVDTVAQGECPNSFTVTRTWTFTDACDNTSSVSQIITVNDTVAPVAPEAPAAVTVACADDIPVMISLTATDNCNDAITAQGVDTVAQGECPNSFTVTRTWTFTDACDNTSSVSQIITVNDTVAPVAPEAPAAVTVACADDIPVMISLTATDNCNDAITAQGVDTVAQGECPNSFTVTRTWTFTDACENTSSVSQIITVNDTVAPVAPEAPAAVTVACADDIPVMISLTATDNCNDAITAQGVDAITQGDCANSFTVTRTWTFTDACENTSSVSQVITVNDTVAPVAPEAPAAVTVTCTEDIPAMISLTATDNCNDAITVQGVDTVAQGDCANSFTVTRTWTFTDACDNTSSVSQIITVNDTVAPVTPEAPAAITVTCANDVPAMITLTATDNCDVAITVQGVDTITQGDCANSFMVTRTWTFTDACDNTSSVSQIITVNDTVDPTFVDLAPADTTASCDNIPSPAVLTAIDNCSAATVTMSQTTIQGNCPSNYQLVRTWTATDACGNTATAVQTITVSDTVGPVSNTPLLVKADATCDNIPAPQNIVFTDNCSEVGTPVFTETQSEVVNGVYTITRTWVVSDACGNLSQTYTQNVYVSQIAEVITLPSVQLSNGDDVNTSLNSLLPQGVEGGTWTNVDNVGGFDSINNTFNPLGIEPGEYLFSYSINDGPCPTRYEVLIIIGGVGPCEAIIIHNAFTPNGDSFNQFFNIENIEDIACYPTNNVQIYNRWGVLVYETKNYDNNTRRFEGISEGRTTISRSEELPTGTYFYIIEWKTSEGNSVTKDGYLYLTR